MHPTIAQILALPVLRAGLPEVIGGGSLERTVRWVHVSDLPDLSSLLQGGELVLTTGAPLADDTTRAHYLTGLAAAGAVGLVIELGTHLHAVPAELARDADELELPVIALHQQIRFVEVTEHVHRSIVSEQYDEVTFARTAHELFTELSMKRASRSEIVDAVADMIDASIVLEDLNHQVLAFAAHGQSTADLLADWDRRSRLTSVSSHTVAYGPESWLTTPVGPHRQEWGRLVVPSPLEATTTRARMALERAAQALALNRMAEQDRTTLEQQAQSGLVDELRRGRIQDEAEATARAHALGLRPAQSFVPMTVRVDETSSDQVLVQRHQVRMLDAVRHAVRSARQTALTANRQPGQIDLLLAQPPVGFLEDTVSEACTAIRSSLLRLDGVSRCAIGVGLASTRLLDAAIGLGDSAHVAEVALSLPQDTKPFHRATDIRLRGLLSLIRSDPRVQAFAETELRALLDHRARYGDDAFDILRGFLDTAGNKTDLAKRLHLSRPTLYAKLVTIQRILGVDLDNAESRTSLHTAMLILDTPKRT